MSTQDTVAALQADVAQLVIDTQLDAVARGQLLQQVSDLQAQDRSRQGQIADLQSQLVLTSAMARPTGAVNVGGTLVPYIPIESLGFGPGADPNQIVKAMTTPGVLTFPPGVFPISGFRTGYMTGFNIPHGPSVGSNGYCHGIVGSGPGSLDGKVPGTYFALQQGSSALTNSSSGIESAYVMAAADCYALKLGQFRVSGSDQGHRHSALRIYKPAAACEVTDVAVDGWLGDSNIPPGETAGFTVIDKNDGLRRDHVVTRLEADGRRPDGKKYGTAPLGGQGMNGGYFIDCYGHDCIASQAGLSKSRNVTFLRLRTARNGSGGGQRAGQGFNGEWCDNITLIAPELNVPRTNGNVGLHVSWSNYGGATPFAPGRLTIIDPSVYYDGVKSAQLEAQSWAPYLASNTATPVVMVAGKVVPFLWAH